MILMGKNRPDYKSNQVPTVAVKVFNTDLMKVTGRKPTQKIYYRHSGVIGNLREETMEHLMKRDSRKALQIAISGMLPKNTLRPRQLKNVSFYKGELK